MKEKKGFKFKKIPAAKVFKRYSAYVYMTAAVVTVAVMAISIYSINQTGDISLPEISVPSIQLPDTSDTPVVNNPTDIPADITPVPEYYKPVSGDIVTAHSVTELVFSPTMQDYRTHTGVDISAEKGTSVVSYTDGTVSAVYSDPFYGTVVELTHANGVVTVYANLEELLPEGISEGSTVKAGQEIGTVGNTAIIESATVPHLHFEVKVGERNVDPQIYLDKVNK